ncbi:MAG: hypothetical protein M1818_005204 [Claussenomyces sp. TS43310]|nr:MAG: hypothetical protein M1818_005204 [Claussenomyces sp. TS43310]
MIASAQHNWLHTACPVESPRYALNNTYSAPYLEDKDVQFVEFTEENHLMQPSPYRGKPTFEIEDAWVKLWRQENMKRLNKTPADMYTHTGDEHGGDILGALNVFHLLHCVNLFGDIPTEMSTTTAMSQSSELQSKSFVATWTIVLKLLEIGDVRVRCHPYRLHQ